VASGQLFIVWRGSPATDNRPLATGHF